MNAFRRELLPPARAFYEGQGGKIGRPNAQGWAPCYGDICPSHRSESKKSFSVNVNHGGWRCFGCDARGDMVRFVSLRDNCDFKRACQSLGAWADGAAVPPPKQQVLERYLVCDCCIDGVQYRVSAKDGPRDYADKIRRFYCEASDRLAELSQGDPGRYADEQDDCWVRMACVLDEIREIENL